MSSKHGGEHGAGGEGGCACGGAAQHPPMQPGWIAATHHSVGLGRFALESGAHIENCVVSCAVHGDVSDTSLPQVLGLCAIGSIHHWLDFLIGPGKALDPGRMRIVVDALGNRLSSSPSNSSTQLGLSFPRFGIRDMVASQKAVLEALDLRGVHSAGPDVVVGASMGGMHALQWVVSYPQAMRKVVALTPMACTAPWAAAVNEAARQSLLTRIGADGRAWPPGLWDGWTPVMQMLAMRTPAQAQAEFGGDYLELESDWGHLMASASDSAATAALNAWIEAFLAA